MWWKYIKKEYLPIFSALLDSNKNMKQFAEKEHFLEVNKILMDQFVVLHANFLSNC